MSHTASNSSPNGNGQHSKRQRRLTNADESDKCSNDLQYYSHGWTGQELDHLPTHVHMMPHVRVKQEVHHLSQHYQCSEAHKELNSKLDHREGQSLSCLFII